MEFEDAGIVNVDDGGCREGKGVEPKTKGQQKRDVWAKKQARAAANAEASNTTMVGSNTLTSHL